MIGPALQDATTLVQIGRSIVDAGYAALMPRNMREQHLNHMRRDAEPFVGHGAQCPPKVVEDPTAHATSRIELTL